MLFFHAVSKDLAGNSLSLSAPTTPCRLLPFVFCTCVCTMSQPWVGYAVWQGFFPGPTRVRAIGFPVLPLAAEYFVRAFLFVQVRYLMYCCTICCFTVICGHSAHLRIFSCRTTVHNIKVKHSQVRHLVKFPNRQNELK